MDPPVSVAAVVVIKDAGHGLTYLCVLVGHLLPCPMVEVVAVWQSHFAEQLRQRVGLPQGINQQRLVASALATSGQRKWA